MKPTVFSILSAPISVAVSRGAERLSAHPFDVSSVPESSVAQASSWSVSRAKRFLDVVASIVGLLLFSPFMLLFALLVGFTSKGPIFFAQRRVGSHGRLFTIFKF